MLEGIPRRSQLHRLQEYLSSGIWDQELASLPWPKRLGVLSLRVLVSTFRGYGRDGCSLHASALTYITLVTLVPMLAIMFSFSKSFGLQERMFTSLGVERVSLAESHLVSDTESEYGLRLVLDEDGEPVSSGLMSELPPAMQDMTLRVLHYVDKTNFAALGLVGTLFLIIGVLCSISKLEQCFNVIWGLTVPQGFLRRIPEYLVILLVFPVFFVFITSLNSMIMNHHITQLLSSYIGFTVDLVVILCKVISFCMLLGFFVFFYHFMPHTKVRLSSSLLAGVVVSLCWFVTLLVYLKLQIGLSKFNTIYGTFAALPFFLALVYAGWCIVLLGGELGYSVQYHCFLHLDKSYEPMPTGACLILGHLVMYEVCRTFAAKGQWDPEQYAYQHHIPMLELRYSVEILERSHLLVRVDDTSHDLYVPGCSPSSITLGTVEEAFRGNQSLDGGRYLGLLPPVLSEALGGHYGRYLSGLSGYDFDSLVSGKPMSGVKA